MDYNISQSAFKFEIRRLIKRILEDVVRNSRLDRDETFRRICHVTSSGRLNSRTLNELDNAVLNTLECYDLKQIRLNEDEDICDFTLSEFGDRRDDLKIGPIPPRCERNIDECEMYALPHRKHIESRRRTHYNCDMQNLPYLKETLDVCYVEEEGELKNYSNLKANLEEKVCGLTMMSSREISLPGRPVLPKLTQIKTALFLLQSKLISCSTAYQLRVGLKYHNKATFVLLSQLERSKMPSLQIRKSGLSVNYEYDLLLCYCPLDREKAIRIQCWINESIDDVSVKLCEEVSTPGHCTFVQAKYKRYIILVTKNMSRVFIHNVELFIVRTAMRNHMPRDFFVLLVEDKSLVPPSLIPLKQIPLQDMGENQVFMDWFQRT
ncbi:unnamed protein product [Mytilus edulis]|uniref:Uncharacterized protein n=1 Tax=Mytilus edulis TaxID=6550 RepID=A0A8S3RQU2_MYTED|nr:unnamed protein product [Mytilus edulis]